MKGAGLLWAILSVGTGLLLAAQGPVNAQLGRALGSPVAAALVSFSVSAVGGLVLLQLVGGAPAWREPPLWLYLAGGCLGVGIVVAAILLVPRLGAATFLACAIFGQLAAGIVLDHVGALGLERHPISAGRVAGVAAVLVGAALLRIF